MPDLSKLLKTDYVPDEMYEGYGHSSVSTEADYCDCNCDCDCSSPCFC